MNLTRETAKQALQIHLGNSLMLRDSENEGSRYPTPREVEQLTGLLTGEVKPHSIEGTAVWLRQSDRQPDENEQLRHALNEVLGTKGIAQHQQDTLRVYAEHDYSEREDAVVDFQDHDVDISFEYFNTGDAFRQTLIFKGDAIFSASAGEMQKALEQALSDSITNKDWSTMPWRNPNPMPMDIRPLVEAAAPAQTTPKQVLRDHLAKGLPYADKDQLWQVVGLLTGEIESESIEGTAAWVRLCVHRPSNEELKRHALNEVLECHGVEHITESSVNVCIGDDDNYEPIFEVHDADIDFEYLNTGESTSGTLIFEGDAVYVASWTDMLQAHEQAVADSVTGTDWTQESFSNPHPMPTDIQPLIDAASGLPAHETLAPAPVSSPQATQEQGIDYTLTHSPGM